MSDRAGSEGANPRYEYAGTWTCEACGEEFDVELKTDPLKHLFRCGSGSNVSPRCRHDGFERRQRELREVQNVST